MVSHILSPVARLLRSRVVSHVPSPRHCVSSRLAVKCAGPPQLQCQDCKARRHPLPLPASSVSFQGALMPSTPRLESRDRSFFTQRARCELGLAPIGHHPCSPMSGLRTERPHPVLSVLPLLAGPPQHLLAHGPVQPMCPGPFLPTISVQHPGDHPSQLAILPLTPGPLARQSPSVGPEACPSAPGEPGEGSEQGRGPEGTPCTARSPPHHALPAPPSPLSLLDPWGPRPASEGLYCTWVTNTPTASEHLVSCITVAETGLERGRGSPNPLWASWDPNPPGFSLWQLPSRLAMQLRAPGLPGGPPALWR